MCPFCHNTALDPFGHHVVTWGDDLVHHTCLWDEVFDLSRRAHLSISVERGHGLTRDLDHPRPADILIAGCDRGKPAALDITITSPLCPAILGESCHQAGAAVLAAEACKLHTMDPNARVRLVLHTEIGAKRPTIPSPGWHLTCMAIHQSSPKSAVIYGQLNKAH